VAILWNASVPGIYVEPRFVEGDDENDDTGRPLPGAEALKFQSRTFINLSVIRSKPIGSDLLSLISKRCQGYGIKTQGMRCKIMLGRGTLADGLAPPFAVPSPEYFDEALEATRAIGGGGKRSTRVSWSVYGRSFAIAGVGNSASAIYNPFINYDQFLLPRIRVPTPPFIALAHELIHCLHTLSGDWVSRRALADRIKVEEARTVGAGHYNQTRISENAIRAEHGLPKRRFYIKPGDCDTPRLG
jgi:hypothetical protein